MRKLQSGKSSDGRREQSHPKAAPEATAFGGGCSWNSRFIDKNNPAFDWNIQ
jgi:hypothetical protein